ncbi:carbonic anhydrase [Nocardioides cavernaquae]|uniref:Carbonic anhydrase n=1 Tax=Nocardioides cavernaquae TaxID=2321396 RepID=A0A3A5HB20_9ACTN|nr:carbonic anhydrase [Nocardioides cavernaquae]RJS47271.1 carbonic anhydrase [Nocardioides cavernaquae]
MRRNDPSSVPSTIPAVVTRRLLLAAGGLAAGASLVGCRSTGDSTPTAAHPAAAGHSSTPASPSEAQRRLTEGNSRFASGDAMHPHQSTRARDDVAGHQAPWALIHGCVDSRVSPELVFDQGIGDVFATRTAGAVLDDTIVGSMEFAASAPYAVPLIVILGHTGCGAVTATVEAMETSPGHPEAPGEVSDILGEIAPVARRVARKGDQAAYIDEVVRANTIAVSRDLVRRSKIIRAAVAAGRTRVIPAVYDLASGRVDWSVS